MDDLNEQQRQAVIQAFEHIVSLVWGPAATGKSHVLAKIIIMAMQDRKERILATASQNVAVDALFDKCVAAFRTFSVLPEKMTHQAMVLKIVSRRQSTASKCYRMILTFANNSPSYAFTPKHKSMLTFGEGPKS